MLQLASHNFALCCFLVIIALLLSVVTCHLLAGVSCTDWVPQLGKLTPHRDTLQAIHLAAAECQPMNDILAIRILNWTSTVAPWRHRTHGVVRVPRPYTSPCSLADGWFPLDDRPVTWWQISKGSSQGTLYCTWPVAAAQSNGATTKA